MLPERDTGCAGACQSGAGVWGGRGQCLPRPGARRAAFASPGRAAGPCGRWARPGRLRGGISPPSGGERREGSLPGPLGAQASRGPTGLVAGRERARSRGGAARGGAGMEAPGMKKAPLDERGFDQHWPEDRRLPYSASAAGASASASGWASSSTTGWSETTFTGTVATMLACRRTRTG